MAMGERLRALRESVVSVRTGLAIALPLGLIVGLAFWGAFQFVEPAPPDRVVIAAGSSDGAYAAFARQYRRHLAQYDITLEILETGGSVDNLARLRAAVDGAGDGNGGAVEGAVQAPSPAPDDADAAAVPPADPLPDLIFLQGGVAPPMDMSTTEDAPEPVITSLGQMFLEPLWLFYREAAFPDGPPTQLADLTGGRVAIGGEGSGTRSLVTRLMRASGISVEPPAFQSLSGSEAVDGLQAARLDAAFFVAAPRSSLIFELLRAEGIALASFARAEGFAQRYPDLQTVTLYAGAIDPAMDTPPTDIVMVAPVASLVARADLHPAVVALLLEAATVRHGSPTLFSQAGAFPRPHGSAFEMNPAAERFLTDGPPFLQRYLPFWLAVLIDRMVVLIIPFVAVMLPLMRFFPPLYAWRMRMRVNRWYRRVGALEEKVVEAQDEDERASALLDLDRLDDEVSNIVVPLGFAHTVYQLRQHVRLVRDRHTQPDTPSTGTA